MRVAARDTYRRASASLPRQKCADEAKSVRELGRVEIGEDASPRRFFERVERRLHLHQVVARFEPLLGPMIAYAQSLAEERFEAGYDLVEVQTAFNALEEASWRRVLADLDPTEFADALGLVSTLLGAGKDALARRYVSLAADTHAPSLDVRALFAGTDSA